MNGWWFDRGRSDSENGRVALFRNRGGRIVAKGETDWTEEEEHENGTEYLRGYDSAEEQ